MDIELEWYERYPGHYFPMQSVPGFTVHVCARGCNVRQPVAIVEPDNVNYPYLWRPCESVSAAQDACKAFLFMNCAEWKPRAEKETLRRELSHLVRLLEPLEQEGRLNIPDLVTLNGARQALGGNGVKEIVPTDSELNKAMAAVCGWTFYGQTATSPGGNANAMVHPAGHALEPWPDYCNDRDMMPEVWQAVESHNVRRSFILCLTSLMGNESSVWLYLQMTPRQHVIAALLAMRLWPDHWQAGAE